MLPSPADKPVWVPACNAYADAQGFGIQAALSRMDRRDIHLAMENGVLIIKGEQKPEESNLKRIYVTREFQSGVVWGS